MVDAPRRTLWGQPPGPSRLRILLTTWWRFITPFTTALTMQQEAPCTKP